MKKFIKQNWLKIFLILLVILILVGGKMYFQERQEVLERREEMLERNGDFVVDIIRAMNTIHAIKDLSEEFGGEDKERALYDITYQSKEKLSKAKSQVEQWKEIEDTYIRKVAENILNGINDLDEAYETILQATKDASRLKEYLALASAKRESGYEKIFIVGVEIVLDSEDYIELSEPRKAIIVNWIDEIFIEAIENYKENKDEENFDQPAEIWAVIIIRNVYAEDLGLEKI